MSKRKKESAYDREIVPLLTQLVEVCKTNGIDMHAAFHLGKESFATGYFFQGPPGHPALRMAHYAVKSLGNFDTFMSTMRKDAAKYGHGSIELALMGIPETPNPDTNSNHEGEKR